MLWLSLHLPHLALEIFTRGSPENRPLLISENRGSRQWVHCCNEAASACGIAPGMALSAARPLLGADSIVRTRDPALEDAALERLADWAGQFTSHLAVVSRRGLLLEIGASLRLFGGLPPLMEKVESGLGELGYRGLPAIAPTPLGARILSRAADTRPVTDRARLRQRLAPLPLELLELEPTALKALKGMGLRCVGDCLALPVAGLARRLGPAVVDYLQRALGERPDPQMPYTPPARFQSRLLLPAEVEHTEGLLFAVRRLLLELEGVLRGRGDGIQHLHLTLLHRRRDPTRLTLGLLAPGRDSAHWQELLKTRLEQIELAAPVEEIVLEAERFMPLPADSGDLFGDKIVEEPGGELVEKLQARLGAQAIHGCGMVADHRPEYAARPCSPGEKSPLLTTPGPRPIWLLEQPVPLSERAGLPWHRGALRLLDGPERIETGWWDGRTVRRDYFVAQNREQQRLWIFRTLSDPPGWYLHGLFA
jgi:protein ImuB